MKHCSFSFWKNFWKCITGCYPISPALQHHILLCEGCVGVCVAVEWPWGCRIAPVDEQNFRSACRFYSGGILPFLFWNDRTILGNFDWYYHILGQMTRNTKILLCKSVSLRWNWQTIAINEQKSKVKEIHFLEVPLCYLLLFLVGCSHFPWGRRVSLIWDRDLKRFYPF